MNETYYFATIIQHDISIGRKDKKRKTIKFSDDTQSRYKERRVEILECGADNSI